MTSSSLSRLDHYRPGIGGHLESANLTEGVLAPEVRNRLASQLLTWDNDERSPRAGKEGACQRDCRLSHSSWHRHKRRISTNETPLGYGGPQRSELWSTPRRRTLSSEELK